MSVFGKIMSAIFGTKASAAPTATGSASAPTTAAPPSSTSSSVAPAAAGQTVDVAAVLDKAVSAQKEKLQWRTSIVDLMKALNLDSSLAARKELASELHYTGDTNDSAKMNIWLHQQVLKKLAENGGKVPDDLKT
jgi:zona occludens toxin (predicted ATPase)